MLPSRHFSFLLGGMGWCVCVCVSLFPVSFFPSRSQSSYSACIILLPFLFLHYYLGFVSSCMHAVASLVSNSLQLMGYVTSVLCPWDSPGKNTVVGCHALLQDQTRVSHFFTRQVLYH